MFYSQVWSSAAEIESEPVLSYKPELNPERAQPREQASLANRL